MKNSEINEPVAVLQDMKSTEKLWNNQVRRESIRKVKQLNYAEALMHILKGNIGTGCFAMAFGFKNAGILVGVVCSVIISLISLHVQHILLRIANSIRTENNFDIPPDYALTMEAAFACSKSPFIKKSARTFRNFCNSFICLTQFGFCCVYLIFVADNLSQVLKFYDVFIDDRVMKIIVFVPIVLSCVILQLKYIAIFSTIATVCMLAGLMCTIGYATRGLPDINNVPLVAPLERYPIFFGVVLFAFEGIALVLPVSTTMSKPKQFNRPFTGVLDVGIAIVTVAYCGIGFIGYWRYGEDIEGSITLNLAIDDSFARTIKLLVSLGIALGVPIAFYVPIEILFPSLLGGFKFVKKHSDISEIIFRILSLAILLQIAIFTDNFDALLSLIGSVCCTMLAFILPVIAELVIAHNDESGISTFIWVKNGIILAIGISGMLLGGGISLIDLFHGKQSK